MVGCQGQEVINYKRNLTKRTDTMSENVDLTSALLAPKVSCTMDCPSPFIHSLLQTRYACIIV